MGELKPGWRRVALGDVVEVVTEYWDRAPTVTERFVAGEHIDEGSLRISRWGLTSDDLVPPTFNRRFRAGDVLFHSRNLRKLACPDFDGITGEKLFVLRSKNPRLLWPELLPFLLQTRAFDEYVNRMWAGSTNKFLNKAPLVKYEFLLPPMEEQRRLAAALTTTDSLLMRLDDASHALGSMARRIAEGVGLHTMDRVPVRELLGEALVRGWSPTCNDQGNGYATLPAGCVYRGFVDTKNNLKFAELDAETYNRYRLKHHDVLVLRGNGNRALVGRAGVVLDPAPACFFPDLLVRLRFDPGQIDPIVAALLWNAVTVHADLVRRTKSSNGIYKLGFDDIREHLLPLPTRDQQSAIRASSASWWAASTAVGGRVRDIERIKTSLLHASEGWN